MASSKDIYEADYYRANYYAAGMWRGLGSGVVVPTVPGVEYRWEGDKLEYRWEGDRLHYRLKE